MGALLLARSNGGGLRSVSGFSRLQPWMSMATRPVTLTASTQKTASLRRERRWLCCSNSEPLGTNGLGLFINVQCRCGLDFEEFWFSVFRREIFPRKISQRFKLVLFERPGNNPFRVGQP